MRRSFSKPLEPNQEKLKTNSISFLVSKKLQPQRFPHRSSMGSSMKHHSTPLIQEISTGFIHDQQRIHLY
jgi:hypothetical protein